ncbi:MAG TPA: FtsX-like permease family protein [Polyangia bacterium]
MSPPVGPGFEWFVAWRHLRDPERRSRKLLIAGVVIVVLGLISLGLSYYLAGKTEPTLSFLRPRPPAYLEYLSNGGIIAIALGLILTYLGMLLAAFTVFTAISIFGVFLGTAAPIIVLSVMSGFEADLKGKIRGAKADIVITRKEDRPFSDFQRVRETIAGIPGVVASTPYLETEVMLNASGAPASVVLRGIDPDSAAGVLDLGRTLREGKIEDLANPARVRAAFPPPRFRDGFPDSQEEDSDDSEPRPALPRKEPERVADPAEAGEPAPTNDVRPTIILGEELYSRSLRVFVGNDVDVVCPLCGIGPTGARPSSRLFRVAGHFYSGMYEFDSKLAYVALEAAQRFLGTHGEVTGVDVRTNMPDRAGEVADAIARVLGPDYQVRSWQELNKGLFMALKLEKIAMFIVLTFIALVASFSIISNLIMMVTEKGREVAILKAMGAQDGAILRVFFAEGLYIGLLGLTVGVTVGVAACQLIKRFGLPLPTDVYYISQLPVVMRAEEIVTVAGLALVLCCLATIYPAILASRLRPVDGLRYE